MANWITPECLSQMIDAFQRATAGETLQPFECALRRKSGEPFPCKIHLQASRDENGQTRVVQSIMHDNAVESALRHESQSRQTQESRLQLINDTMTDLVCQINADGIVEYVSSSIMRVTGRSADYWLGKSAFVLLESVHPDDQASVLDVLQNALANQTETVVRYRYQHADGHYVWFESTGRSVEDLNGRLSIVYAARDITRQKMAEDALREQDERLQLITNHIEDVILLIGMDGLTHYISPSFKTVSGHDPADFVERGADALGQIISPVELLTVGEAIQQVLLTGQTQKCEFRVLRADGQYIDTEAVYSPVLRDGHLDGVLSVSRNITTRKAAEKALQERESQLRLITDNMADVVSAYDLDGITRYVSPSMKAITGFTPEQLIGEGLVERGERIHPDDMPITAAAIQQVYATHQSQKAEYRTRRADDTYIWVETMFSPLLKDKEMVGFSTTTRDITTRKQTEIALRESEERLRLTLSAIQAGWWDWNMHTGSAVWAKEIYALMGYPPDEIPVTPNQAHWLAHIHPDDRAMADAAFKHMLETGTSLDYEARVVWSDGSLHWIQNIGKMVADSSGGAQRAVGILMDITARKQAELTLRESEQRLNLTLQAAKAGSWEWNLRTYSTRWSDQEFVLLGQSPGSLVPTLEKWMACVHPDDRDNLLNRYYEAIQNKEICDLEYRTVWPDGSVHWLHDISQTWYDRDDVPERVIGITMDITARKQAELTLRQSEERLQFALQAARTGMWESTLATQETLWSEQEYTLMGRSPADFTPTTEWWKTCIHPDDQERAATNYYNAILNQVSSDQEYRVVWPDGSIHWLHDMSQAQYGPDGLAERLVGITMDITERKQGQEALRQSEQRLHLALQAAKAVAWETDLVSQVKHWSDEEYALIGRSRADYTPTMDWWKDCVHPDDREAVVMHYYNSILNQTSSDQEYRVVWPDGSVHWLHDMSQARYGAGGIAERLVGITMDVTERKQAQEALRQSEERLRLITDAMSDSVGQVDGNGRLQYMSRAFEAWTGQDASLMMQEAVLDWSKFIHPDDLGQMATLFSTLSEADRPVRMDHRVLAADGSILWFETVANVLREADGGFGGAIFVSRNIDERRQAEKNALELAAERKMVAALRNILSNVSHDFRTPISVINSSMYLLRRKAGEDFPGLRHLIAIEDQTERMANMVETMFTVSYLEDDDYLLSPVEVTGLVRNVLVRRQESAARKKLLLVNNMPAVPVYTMAEAVMLNRAVDSLLLNALQYTPEGGSITVNGHVQADRVVIEVVDTGMGISAKDLPHIFESFYRADKARNIDHGSTGLGLTIAQRIIQRHNGVIEVESEPDAGSTFRIILPLLKDGEQQQP